MRTNLARHRKSAQILAKKLGTTITVQWTEWPDGEPDEDPTSGAKLATDDLPQATKSCETKVMIHYIAPASSALRVHAECEVGDAILDFLHGFVRVIDVGDTDLDVGDVLDEYAFNAACNAAVLADGDPAVAETVELSDLEDPQFIIEGQAWVQKETGADLKQAWDVVVAGVQFAQSILVRRAT